MDENADSGHRDDAAGRDLPAVELVVFVGLQASGKSTLFREWFAATDAHVSKHRFPNNGDRGRKGK